MIRRLLRFGRLVADRLAFCCWLGLCHLIGRIGRRTRGWTPSGKTEVLVLAPHPDDEALGCGGTIAKHVVAGDSVTVAIVTDGRKSSAGGLSEDEMAAARESEARDAARRLGVNRLLWLGLREGEWHQRELTALLGELFEHCRPALVYAPCWLDYHPEHRRTAGALAHVLPSTVLVRIYTLHVPLGQLVNVRVDVTAEMPLLREVFATYRTQRYSLMRGLRLRRYAGAIGRCGRAAEEFCEMTPDAFRRSHLQAHRLPRVRGIRYWAFSDPLAYAVGIGSRQHFARRVRGTDSADSQELQNSGRYSKPRTK